MSKTQGSDHPDVAKSLHGLYVLADVDEVDGTTILRERKRDGFLEKKDAERGAACGIDGSPDNNSESPYSLAEMAFFGGEKVG